MSDLETILNLLQDAEERAFYAMSAETDRFRKGHRKVIDRKIRDAIEEIAHVLDREREQDPKDHAE